MPLVTYAEKRQAIKELRPLAKSIDEVTLNSLTNVADILIDTIHTSVFASMYASGPDVGMALQIHAIRMIGRIPRFPIGYPRLIKDDCLVLLNPTIIKTRGAAYTVDIDPTRPLFHKRYKVSSDILVLYDTYMLTTRCIAINDQQDVSTSSEYVLRTVHKPLHLTGHEAIRLQITMQNMRLSGRK